MSSEACPAHYSDGSMDRIEKVIDGLPADKAVCLFNILKYYERAGKKDDEAKDLAKANDYAHRLAYGKWPWEAM